MEEGEFLKSYFKSCAFLVVITLTVVFASSCYANSVNNCTIFTASNENNTIYANNEDTHFGELIIGFFPAANNEYGSIHFGYLIDKVQSFQGAVNDRGLIWDVNSVPKTKMNPHPERTYSQGKDNYFTMLSKRIASVEEAIQLSHEFDFGDSMSMQIHIADSSGDAVVIGPGPDGEIAYTRKGEGNRFLVSTNFSLADDGKNKCWRYDAAVDMLESVGDAAYSIDYISEIVEKVHLRTITSFTLYSNIVDLTNKKVYIYYMSQYDERIEFDIDEELSKGKRVINMSTLFSNDTVKKGDEDYRRFETRFTVYKISVIVIAVLFVSGAVLLIILLKKKIKKKKKKSTGGGNQNE